MKISAFKAIIKPASVSFESGEDTVETVDFSFRLGALDNTLADRMVAGLEVADWIETVVNAWDVTNDDGEAVPVTADAMKANDIPTPFLRLIQDEVYRQAQPSFLRVATVATASAA